MENNKHINERNERIGVDSGSMESPGSERAQNNDPPPDENSETLHKVISRLQTVRVPGCGRVDPEETIAVAIAQGKAFQRWCDEGAPVGDIEVWVEGNRVISAIPEPPAQLQEFKFSVPSPDTAVLQVTTQSRGERTVLYNLLLRDVPANGVCHEEKWPNGQSMSLQITRRATAVAAAAAGASSSSSAKLDEFCIQIAIYQHETRTQAESKANKVRGASRNRFSGERTTNNNKARARAAGAGALSIATVALLLFCLAAPIVLIGKTLNANRREEHAALQPLATDAPAQGASIASSLPSSNAGVVESASEFYTQTSTGVASTTERASRNVRRTSEASQERNRTTAITKVGANDRGDTVAGASEPWQATVFPKLAVLKNMYVRMDAESEPARLKSFFIQALEASDQFNVVSDQDQKKADGVITLSFERSSPCVGVVFAKVTGPDGKFLWEDHKWEAPRFCMTIQNSQDKMFDDASTALVDSLEKTVRQAQDTTASRYSSVDGG